jgi:hypothetical protein
MQKVLFIHIPKTTGTSIASMFYRAVPIEEINPVPRVPNVDVRRLFDIARDEALTATNKRAGPGNLHRTIGGVSA